MPGINAAFKTLFNTGINMAGAAMMDQRRCGLWCGLGAIDGRQQIDDDRK